ncbi:MAG: hypothetical protein IMZ50_09920 [Candidatus Atribacteria bacterium]|nr:hypothetical protein [Candidatus Atribacteria bacterium]
MQVYVTKWALTQGIVEKSVREVSDGDVRVIDELQYFHPGEWHRTWVEAVVQAEKMQTLKIAALKRRLAKLEGMRFDA